MSSGSVIVLARQAIELTSPVPCRDGEPRLWFAEDPEDLELAKAHCRSCPLQAACLAGAIERREPCGVWGGEIFDRGRILPVKRRRGRPHIDRAAPAAGSARGVGAGRSAAAGRGTGAAQGTGGARSAGSARAAISGGPGARPRQAGPARKAAPTRKDRATLREMCG